MWYPTMRSSLGLSRIIKRKAGAGHEGLRMIVRGCHVQDTRAHSPSVSSPVGSRASAHPKNEGL